MTDEPSASNTPSDASPSTDATDGNGASGSLRLTEPPNAGQAPRLPFAVVGVGASAGGLEAYTELLNAMPPDTGMAFVFIQHLPPDRESLLVDLLSKQTSMPVWEVTDGQTVEPNSVYVIRPGHTLTIKDGKLHLGAELAARGHSRPVDDFFRSLAEEQQQRAIAVVLSGMGSNGTAGAQAVKAVGGLVIAQDPETAKFPPMPRSLIDNHLTDFVLHLGEIPEVLQRYTGHPYAATDRPPERVPRREEQPLAEILGILRARTRHDFTGYRKPTLIRRIQRRMGLGQVASMAEYAKELRQSPNEVTTLADDLLIHVTGFFRDPEVWEALKEKVIDPLTAERPDGSSIRCWVTACATGEEAYTLAILLLEAAEAKGKLFDIKVFATDMAERALGLARGGVFPGGIESEVTPGRLERFFDKDDSIYRVKREVREAVVFAPQNVLQDPPFSRLDITTCRNLLIYLEQEVQKKVLALLHFGLREGGTLILGTSESVGPGEDLFEPIDRKNRLFRRVGPTRHGNLEFPLPPAVNRGNQSPTLGGRSPVRATIAQMAHHALLEEHTPAATVVDELGRIVFFHGNTGRYLDQPRGEPTQHLLDLADEQVRGAVRTALHRANTIQAAVTVRDGLITTTEGVRRVEVGAVPLDRRSGNLYYLITFRDFPEPPSPPLPTGDLTAEQRLVDELARTRDELQSALEEMQTSNEEMRSSHEEVTSANEELQSTNEELETSKEELQSLNEELTTVNAQYQAKQQELEATSNDLTSLLTSTDIAVIFLDQRFRIRRYTPASADLFDLIPSDVGRPVHDLRRKFTDADLLPDAQRVLDKLIPIEREVTSESGRQYLRRVLPYRTSDNRIDGVVVAFMDVSVQRRHADAAVRASEERQRLIVQSATDYAIFTLTPDRVVTIWSPGATAIFGYTGEDIIGQSADMLFTPEDRAAGAPEQEAETARRVGRAANERWHVRKNGSRFFASGVLNVLRDGGGFVKVARDLTERKRIEEELSTRVAERTTELAAAVGALETEIERRRELARRLTTAAEDERRRIARELHDSLGQYLAAMSLELTAAHGLATQKDIRDRLGRLVELTAETGREVHRLALELRPTALDDLGLESALQNYVEAWSSRTGLPIEYGARGLNGEQFTLQVSTAVYRVVQEALTNVARHAHATRVSVLVERQSDHLSLVVEDDGVGFDPDRVLSDPPARGGLGLLGMRERVALLDGTIQIESAAGTGTAIYVRIPIPARDGGAHG